MRAILVSSLTAGASLQTSVCADEVVMFQTIRLPVLIGLLLFLGAVVICSQLLFVKCAVTVCFTVTGGDLQCS